MVFPLSILRQSAQDSISDLPALKDAATQVAAQILQGSHGQKRAGGSETFWQFREYSDADRPQDIDWRQSAKTDHVYVREKELQTPQSVYVWAHRGASMDFQSGDALHSKQEAAQILSLALAMLFMRGDERVGVLGQKNAGHSDNALDKIGRFLLEDDEAIHPTGNVPSKSTLVLCSDFLEPPEDIEYSFDFLSGQQTRGIVLQVIDPAERDLTYDGHLVFNDGSAQKHKIDHVSSIREAYQDKVQAHIDAIEGMCKSLGWSHYLHVTDRPLHETLLRIWEAEQR